MKFTKGRSNSFEKYPVSILENRMFNLLFPWFTSVLSRESLNGPQTILSTLISVTKHRREVVTTSASYSETEGLEKRCCDYHPLDRYLDSNLKWAKYFPVHNSHTSCLSTQLHEVKLKHFLQIIRQITDNNNYSIINPFTLMNFIYFLR